MYENKLNESLEYYKNKTLAIIGASNQDGLDYANNLKKQGIHVIIGVREDDEIWNKVNEVGFEVYTLWEAVNKADIAQVW